MRTCPQCGSYSPDYSQFCSNCGSSLTTLDPNINGVTTTQHPGRPPDNIRRRKYRVLIPGLGLGLFRRDPQTGRLGCGVGCLVSTMLAAIIAVGSILLLQHSTATSSANLSVTGNAVPGGSIQVHGRNFPPNSKVAITVDGTSLTSYNIGVPAPIADISIQEISLHPSDNTITVASDGTFDMPLPIPLDWEPSSRHIIRATPTQNASASTQASVDVVIQSVISDITPTTTSIVPPNTTPTATSTVPPTGPRPTVSKIAPTSGPASGGTTIKLSGTHFTNATTVSFGSHKADVTFVSDTQINVVSPSANSSGTVDVTVTTLGGTSATSNADRFTYIPAISSISTTSGPINGGTTVTITGSGFTGATNVSFGTYPASNFAVVSNTQITVVSPPANSSGTVVDVTITTPSGTSAPSSADRFTYVYIPPPVVTKIDPTIQYSLTGGTTVTIYGSGFTNATTVSFGTYTAQFTFVSDTQITAVSPTVSSARTVDVTVTTPGGISATSSADQLYYSLIS